MKKYIWVSWENHRRSSVLAEELGAVYKPITTSGSRPKRYLILPFRTIFMLLKTKPDVVICQNPSMFLTYMLCTFRTLFGYRLCVDRHSNFKFETKNSSQLIWRAFHYLSKKTVKDANLTIVTNDYLKEICESWGGRSVVLEDKLPELNAGVDIKRPGFMVNDVSAHVMCVTMFDDDEPIVEIICACKGLENIAVYLTGNYKKQYTESEALELEKHNIYFTGFISNDDYVSLMNYVDVVVVLTIKEYILNCGAYEALSLARPLVLSDTITLKNYFQKGAIFVKPDEEGIKVGIEEALLRTDSLKAQIYEFRPEMEKVWEEKFSNVKKAIENMT